MFDYILINLNKTALLLGEVILLSGLRPVITFWIAVYTPAFCELHLKMQSSNKDKRD